MDILNLGVDDFISQSQQKVRAIDENIFDPDVSKAPNGVYKAVLRFIPWHAAKSAEEFRYKKYAVKITNPITNERLWLDDPSTIGNSSVFWNIESKLKALEKEEPEVVKEIKKWFNRFYKYYSLVYIKKDPQNPQLEGKIKVFPYGHTIWKMTEQLLHPEGAELGASVQINPFSLLNGRDFLFVAKKKTQQWRDFDSCKFVEQDSPFIVKTASGNEVAYQNTPEAQQKFMQFLQKNSPDMTKYHFKEWAEGDYDKAAQALRSAISYKQILDDAFASCRDEKIKAAYERAKTAKVGAPTTAPKATDLLADDLDSNVTFNAGTPAKKTTAKSELDEFETPAATTSSNATSHDDMFDDL